MFINALTAQYFFDMEITIRNIDAIKEAARQFVGLIGNRRVFAFYGTMGAGKTTFIKAVCEELGVKDVITSPTFAIVNEYSIDHSPSANDHSVTAQPMDNVQCSMFNVQCSMSNVYHFDFYRIKRLEEVYDMGYEDYFYSGCLCFIEWPELIEELLPEDAVRVTINEQPDGSRTVTLH